MKKVYRMNAVIIVWPQTFKLAMTFPRIFKVKFWNRHFALSGGPIDMAQKGCELDTVMLDRLCNFEIWPQF